MRRRLDVGLGIVHRPAVLFLDEPTTGLDPQARARMWDEIRALREHGTTVFLTTHYLEEADALADRLAIIDHGRIVAEGTADELKQRGRRRRRDDRRRRRRRARPRARPRTCSFVREASDERRSRPALRRPGRLAVPQLLRCSTAPGFAPTSITLHSPSLDDVFLRQTGRSLREEAAAMTPTPSLTVSPHRHHRKETLRESPSRHLAHLPALDDPHPAPAGLDDLRA